jgi:signal transduction histidine kinase
MQYIGLRSIRWQLPLTYAAIALVAAVSLTGLLLGLLRPYFAQQEIQLLETGSQALAMNLSRRLDAPLSEETLPDVLRSLRFVPDFRVELLDPEGETVFDSGLLDTFVVRMVDPVGPDGLPMPEGEFSVAAASRAIEAGVIAIPPTAVAPGDAIVTLRDPNTISVTPVDERILSSRGLFGEAVTWQVGGAGAPNIVYSAVAMDEPMLFTRQRSNSSITTAIPSFSTGGIAGFVRLSNPPAIGSNILQTVLSGALIAGTVAVIFAALLGWWVSLRLTQPLVELTHATARMMHGDLSVRVDVPRSTELGTLAESFNAMAGKVEGTVAALRRFAADAAHELHTPLAAMKTNLELTQERPDQSRLAEAVVQISRLEALADDLLDLSRLEVAEPAANEPVDTGALVREVSEVYASRAEQAGVEFALTMCDNMPAVWGSASLLRRALCNLLDNAVKFTPSGGDVLLAASTGDGTLEFVVEDTGIGIPSEDLPVLFSRFHRGSNTSGYPGSGLGLAIVKAIADVHLGTVLAENTSKGARFVFRMPAAAKP